MSTPTRATSVTSATTPNTRARLRVSRTAAVLATAATAAAILAPSSASAAPAHAAAPQTKPSTAASCSSFYVGRSINYNAYGYIAGTISQTYSTCDGRVYAEWLWNPDFVRAYSNSTVTLGLGSMGLNGGAPVWDWNDTRPAAGSPRALYLSLPHGMANPDSWRAGAIIDKSNCAAWTSQHYYANGSETAGPYAGCNDTQNLTQIPWTQP